QIGRVIIGDDVEIGANSTVDRGSLSDTVIGAGTKIDNLVQIAHNVVVVACPPEAIPRGMSESGYFQRPMRGQGKGWETVHDGADHRAVAGGRGSSGTGTDDRHDLPRDGLHGAELLSLATGVRWAQA